MSSELLTVEVVGKYGPKANGMWFGLKKPLKSSDFEVGQTYEVETEEWGNSTKGGLNIVSMRVYEGEKSTTTRTRSTRTARPSVTDPEKKTTPPSTNHGADRERSQMIGGLAHDAATITNSLVIVNGGTEEQAIATFEKVLKRLVAIRDNIS